MNDENIKKVQDALNEAEVPLDNRYYLEVDGSIVGPITINRSEFVPTDNKEDTPVIHKIV